MKDSIFYMLRLYHNAGTNGIVRWQAYQYCIESAEYRLLKDFNFEVDFNFLVTGQLIKNKNQQPFVDLNAPIIPDRDVTHIISKIGSEMYLAEDEIRKKDKQQKDLENELKELQKYVSQSVIDTNNSIIRLNENIIPAFNRIQQRTSNITLIVASLSFVAITISAYESTTVPTKEQYELTNKLLIQQQKSLRNILQYQKEIDSSLQIMAKKNDTIFLKK